MKTTVSQYADLCERLTSNDPHDYVLRCEARAAITQLERELAEARSRCEETARLYSINHAARVAERDAALKRVKDLEAELLIASGTIATLKTAMYE